MPSQKRLTPFAVLAAVVLSTTSACSSGGGSAAEVSAAGLPLTGVQITPADALLFAGSVMAFQAQGVYEDGSYVDLTGAVAWSSSNEEAATVSGGVVTALAVGDTTITASDTVSGFTAYATIRVTDVPGALASVTLSRGSVVGGEALTGTVTLNARIDQPVVVTLWTDNAAVTVPASVTIPAGEISASFDVATGAVAERAQVLVHAWDETFDTTYERTASLNVRAER